MTAALEGATKGLDAAEATALDGVGKVAEALREAFAAGVRSVYGVAIAIAALAALVTFFVPELPLRGRGPAGPPPPVE